MAVPSVNRGREARHDRHAGTYDSGSHHDFCSGYCLGAALVVLEGGVFVDAASYGSEDSGANGTGARNCAIGAGLFGATLSILGGRALIEACATGFQGVEGSSFMAALRWLLMLVGAAVFGSAGALVAYDIYLSEQLRRLLSRNKTDESGADLRVHAARKPTRYRLTLRMNFLGDSAGQGFR